MIALPKFRNALLSLSLSLSNCRPPKARRVDKSAIPPFHYCKFLEKSSDSTRVRSKDSET